MIVISVKINFCFCQHIFCMWLLVRFGSCRRAIVKCRCTSLLALPFLHFLCAVVMRYYVMHIRHQFASRLIPLVVLCMLIGFSAHPTQASQASSTLSSRPENRPGKGTLQILPKKLTDQMLGSANTMSIYESTTDAATMYKQGCSAAHGAPGLLILDWGQPVYFGNNTYGTYDFGGHDDTDTAILHAVANFAQGVWYCRTSTTDIAIAVGESNYYSANAIPLTTAAWYADGQQWGTMINNLQSFLTNNH